jgi:hypothetical protein
MFDAPRPPARPKFFLEAPATRPVLAPFFGTSFSTLRRRLNIPWPMPADRVAVPSDFIAAIIRHTIGEIRVNESWYLEKYPDIRKAIADGLFGSARHHYQEFGFFEDRLPDRIEVDTAFYLHAYPDVAQQIMASRSMSPQGHFETYGFQEGRLPREGWDLFS